MFLGRSLALVFVCLLTATPFLAQQPPPSLVSSTPVRDPQAIAVITNAIQALGGQAAVAQLQTVQTNGSIAPASASPQTAGTFVWTDQIISTGFEFRAEFHSAAGTSVFVSGHGKPAQTAGGRAQSLQPHVAEAVLPYHLPAILLAAEMANPDYSFSLIGQASVNGQPAIRLHFSLETDDVRKAISPQEWYFDVQTGLPLRVEYRVPSVDNAAVFQQTAAEFGDFRRVGPLLLPFKLSVFKDGSPQSVIAIDSFDLNPSVSPTDFDFVAVAAGVQ